MDRTRLAADLKNWFKSSGMTQTELGSCIGADQGHISRLLSGEIGPRSKKVIDLCNYANIDLALYEPEEADLPLETLALMRRIIGTASGRKRSVMRVLKALEQFD